MILLRFVYICVMKRSTLLLLVAFSLIAVACPMTDPDNPRPKPNPPTPTPTNDSTTVSISATRKIGATDLFNGDMAKLLTLESDGTYAFSF